jgi:hypothetical protein
VQCRLERPWNCKLAQQHSTSSRHGTCASSTLYQPIHTYSPYRQTITLFLARDVHKDEQLRDSEQQVGAATLEFAGPRQEQSCTSLIQALIIHWRLRAA